MKEQPATLVVVATLASLALTGCLIGRPADTDFSECGTLVQGVECVLFETDDGRQVLLENSAGFTIGDDVQVTGRLDPTCATICQRGEGCIRENTIAACGS